MSLSMILLLVGIVLLVLGILEVVRRPRGDRAVGVIILAVAAVVLLFSPVTRV